MESGVQIRPFRTEDQPAIRVLIVSGWAEHSGDEQRSAHADIDDIMADYVLLGNPFFVAESDSRVVGCGGLLIRGRDLGQMVRVAVSPQHRRRGIGRALVERLVREARDLGLARVIVESDRDWQAAIALYLACGFSEFDRDERDVWMELHLESP